MSAGVVTVVAAGVLGLLVGSFLTVVVHRVPAGRSVVLPRSACPSCVAPIRPRDNVPVLSWVLLRGRCRDCGAAVPVRYPAVEAATGLLFAGVAAVYGRSPVLPALLWLSAAGVALTLIDLDHHRLPDAIVLPSYPVVGISLGAAALLTDAPPVGRTLLSAATWLALYGALWLGTAGRGMGLGDVKLAGSSGPAGRRAKKGKAAVADVRTTGEPARAAVLTARTAEELGRATRNPVLVAAAKQVRAVAVKPDNPKVMLAGAALGAFLGEPLWNAWLGYVGLA